MMMTPERRAELNAKARPLLEALVETLNKLNDLSGHQPVIASHGQIMTAGGTVDQDYKGQWSIVDEN